MSLRLSQLLPTKRAGDHIVPAYPTTLPCFPVDFVSYQAEYSRPNELKLSRGYRERGFAALEVF